MGLASRPFPHHFEASRAMWAAAGSMDTGLSFLSFLELYRTDVAEC